MKAFVPLLCLALAGLAGQAQAQVDVDVPILGGPQWPPYGPGFNGRVIIGPREGCRNFDCPPGQYQNRPYHRRYYDRYFDVPTPEYARPSRSGGNRAFGGTHLTDTRPATKAAPQHRDWCAGRYRSYRPSDNSFQPTDGARRQCESPYS